MKKLFFLLFIVSTSLYAGREITSVTLDGGSSVSVKAGETIEAHLSVTLTTDKDWRGNSITPTWSSTAWRIGDSGRYTCVNHTTFSGVGTHDETFTIAAPFSAGIYDVSFIAYRNRNCHRGRSNTYVMDDAAQVSGNEDQFVETNTREFTRVFQINLNGNIKMIGNTILGKPSGSVTACPDPGEDNAKVNAQYYYPDSASGIYGSSSATLDIPSGSTVVKAYLLWQGLLTRFRKDEAVSVKFKTPTSGGYIDIQTDPEKLNWTEINPWGGPYYPYQGMTEVTDYVKQEGVYHVANLATTEGKVSTYGTFGAWGLVVIYSHGSESFKNITVYDGYKVVSGPLQGKPAKKEEATLSGFLTPSNGDIRSNFLVFAGEGDSKKFYKNNDYIKLDGTPLSNKLKYADNAFDATITENGVYFTAKDPNCKNNMGIDITTYDVGATGQNLIGIGQSSASITLGSDVEAYYPGFFAFSTDLYVPDVCYEETITKEGVVPERIYQGEPLDVNVTIKNMSYEPAKGVSISRFFDTSLEYDPDSTSIEGDPMTDTNDTDRVEYDSDDELLRLNIGDGATATTGGKLAYLDAVDFTYRLIPVTPGDLVSEYKVSYRDESNGSVVQYDQVAIGKCSDRSDTSTQFSVHSSGTVRIVTRGEGWNYGNVKTQLADAVLQFDVLYATDESGTDFRGGTTIDTVELIDYVSGGVVESWQGLTTDSEGKVQLEEFTLNAAYRKLFFRITDGGSVIATSNTFSVRPSSMDIGVTAGFYIAGKTYSGKLRFSAVAGYNQVAAALSFTARDEGYGDGIGTFTVGTFAFNGTEPVEADLSFSDVGDIKLEAVDSDWASVDRANDLCIADSCSNMRENGLVGCDLCGSADANLSFIPDRFTVSFLTTPRLDDNSSFTYFSEDPGMSARLSDLDLSVTAVNSEGETTLKYSDGGYEKNIALTLDANISDLREKRPPSPFDAAFTDGVATLNVAALPFNYGKNSRIPRNPVRISGDDVNLSVVVSDTDSVTGQTFRQGVDDNATFFYGRINPIDANCLQGRDCPVTVNYEVYCKGCDRAAFGMNTWHESVNDVNWYVNPGHPADQLVGGSSLPFADSAYDDNGAQILNYTNFPTGRKRVTLQHTDNLQAPFYLYHHPYSDQNVSSFYLDVAENITPDAPGDVIDNEGDITIGGSRIGE